MSKRLIIFTDLSQNVLLKEVESNFRQTQEYFIYTDPRCRVTLKKHVLKYLEYETEVYIEEGVERVLRDHIIVEKAFEVYTKDLIC